MIVQPDEITAGRADPKTTKSKLVCQALLPSGQYWFMHALALYIPIPVYMYTFAMTNILHTNLLRHILAFSLPESCWYYCILSCTKSPNLCCPFLLVRLHNSNAARSESQSTPTMASLAARLTMQSPVVIGKTNQIHGKLKPFEAIEAPRQQEGWHEFKNYIQLMPGRRDLIGLTPLEYTELNWQSRRNLVLLVVRVIVPFRESWVATAALILQASMCEGFIPTRLELHVLECQWMPMSFLCTSVCLEYCWIFLDIWYSFFPFFL